MVQFHTWEYVREVVSTAQLLCDLLNPKSEGLVRLNAEHCPRLWL